MEKVKVLELPISNLGRGGTEVMVWNWYHNFSSPELVIDFLGDYSRNDEYIKSINSNHGEYYKYTKYTSPKIFGKIINTFGIMRYAKKIAKNNDYDVIHIHAQDAFIAFTYYLAVKPFCKKIIIHSHCTGTDVNSGVLMKLKRFLHKVCRCLLNSKKVIRLACSKAAGEWMYPPKYKFEVINNGIDVKKFTYNEEVRNRIRSELKVDNKFVIGNIGRFSIQKNHEFLLDIFNEVLKKNPNAVLLLIGDGPLENKIKEKTKNLGIEKSVIFYGTTSSTNELYQAMDCFVLSSLFEGLPIVLVEAQAAGLKTLCSDAITQEAKITGLLDYLPLSGTQEKWAEKILSYNDRYERKDLFKEVKNAGYDIKQSAKRLEEIYVRKMHE